MSSIEIRADQFPKAIPNQLAVGETVRLTVTARIHRIEDERVQVAYFGRDEVEVGERTTALTILAIEEACNE